MITFKRLSLQDFLKSYSTPTPSQKEIELFQKQIAQMLQGSQAHHREKSQEQEISELLNTTFAYRCRSRDNIDLAILQEGRVSVILEVKSLENKSEFPSSPDNPLSKALYEAILYFLRETYKEHNNSLKHIILCTPCEFFIFDATQFLIFSKDKYIKSFYKNCDEKEGTDKSTQKFYNDLHLYFSTVFSQEISYTYFSLSSPQDLPLIYTLLSPQVLLKSRNTIDANTLNQGFYEELLYILGLQEVEESGKILIRPSSTPNSLTSSILREYPNLDEEEVFTLITTWNNRILFLALLESMLLGFKHIDKPFLDIASIPDFPTLGVLFFEVLAKKLDSRSPSLPQEFASIPYLNSSLFDRIALECEGKDIKSLISLPLPLFSRSILKKSGKKELPLLEYLFNFLHAYDFTTTPKDIKEGVKQNHDKLINSAVLGLVFEKLNGYKEGSFYTPSFITSFMCRQSITQATLEKYNATYGWECQDLKDLVFTARFSKVSEEDLLSTLLSLKICDPSVGSGHFLVSALNEIIYIAYSLGLFQHLHPSLILEIENDEILIQDRNGEYFCYTKPTHPQDHTHKLQEEIFNLKKSIIENCLFGVDINPNSCEITKLRLWIELLKYSYYLFDTQGNNTNALETLPNIDINIKCGNSLISRFSLDDKLSKIPNIKKKIKEYKELVAHYKDPDPLFPLSKSTLESKINELKTLFALTLKDPKTKNELEKAIKHHFTLYNDFALDDESLLEGLSVGEKNLFGTPSLSEEEQENAFASYGRIKALRKKLDTALSGEEYHDAFEWRFEFPEVLDSEGNFLGFDCVIGNPPYIRIQGLDRAISKHYQKIFSTATKNYDIYVLFVEKCLKLLSPHAQVGFIMPHKWLNSDFGEGLRKLARDKVREIISFGHFQVFQASTYTALQWFGKESRELRFLQAPQKAESSQQMQTFLQSISPSDYLTFPTSSLTSSPWYFGADISQKIFQKIFQHTPMKEIFSKMFQGIATSKDDVYFLYDCQEGEKTTLGYSKALDKKVEIENSLLKPLLMGDSFHRYDTLSSTLKVLFPYYQGEDSKGGAKMYLYEESTLKKDFPKGYAYLKKCEKILRAREKGRLQDDDKWWRYIYPKNQLLFGKEKLLCPDICDNMQFSLDCGGKFYFTTTIYGYIKNENFEHLDYRFLMAILNSKLAWWYLSQTSSVLRGGYYRIKPAYIQDFAIPCLESKEQKPFIELVDEILLQKETNNLKKIQELEERIDNLVYSLYNLMDKEIKSIENKE